VPWKVNSPSNAGVSGKYASLTQYPTWNPALYNPVANPEVMGATDHVGTRLHFLFIGLALALSVAACGGSRSASKTTQAVSVPAASAALPNGSRLVLDTGQPLCWGYAADGSLYYAYANPVGSTSARTTS
jgi:hypothetical protein